jgi:hypothetical protein
MKYKNIFLLQPFLLMLILFIPSCNEEAIKKKPVEKSITSSITTPNNARIAGYSYWYFYRGASNDRIYYAYSNDGTSWLGNTVINNNATTNCGPSAIYFNGKFIVAFRGLTNAGIHYVSSTDGVNWTAPVRTAAETHATPSLVVWNNELYCFYVQSPYTNGKITFMKTTDGVTWSSPQIISPITYSQGGIATAVEPLNNKLHLMFHLNDEPYGQTYLNWCTATSASSSGSPFFSTRKKVKVSNSIWTEQVNCPNYVNAETDDAPGIAFLNGSMYVSLRYNGGPNHNLLVLKRNNNSFVCPEWTRPALLEAYTAYRPSMISQDGKLTVIYKPDGSNNNIYYSKSTDGINWSAPTTAIGQTLHGGVCIIGG